MSTWKNLTESVASKKGAFTPEPEMSIEEAEKILASEVARLQASPNRAD